MPLQPPSPLPDGHPAGRSHRRQSAQGGHPSGGYTNPAGGYPGDYPAPYPDQQRYPAPPDPWQAAPGAGDDYPSGEYPTGAFTGGMTPLAPPGNQHDLRATGSFDAASDPMSRYEQYSVYDDEDRRGVGRAARATYGNAAPRASRHARAAPPAGAELPWYRETWMVALGLAVALLIGVMVGALAFG